VVAVNPPAEATSLGARVLAAASVAPSVKERMLPHRVIILLCGAPFSPDEVGTPRWD